MIDFEHEPTPFERTIERVYELDPVYELEMSPDQFQQTVEASPYYTQQFENPDVNAFYQKLLDAIITTGDPNWSVYALRHMPLLTFPTKNHTRVCVGETI
jgi:hypothetical protein